MMGAFLFGCLVGACAVFVLTGLGLYFIEVRRAWREGSELSGEELERAKRRNGEF